MARVIDFLPEISGEEMVYIQNLIDGYDDNQARSFTGAYRAQRKDPTAILILTLLGFVFLAGIHRFLLGQVGMGILYLLTGGLCWIGTIVDLVNYQKLAFEANQKAALAIASMLK
jgi:TM2 domain-containing membrane protein YozV